MNGNNITHSITGINDTPSNTVSESMQSKTGTNRHNVLPFLETKHLRVTFTQDNLRFLAVDDVSYKLFPGKTLAIIGESGSGKTTSCRALMGLLPGSATVTGSVCLEGKELLGLTEQQLRVHRGSDIAMVFQDPARSLNPTMKIGHQITEAIREHQKLNRYEAKEQAIELLTRLQLSSPRQQFSSYPHQLSGGMRQRVVIAIALAGNPKILIADEATNSLDVTTQAIIMELLMELQEQLDMALIMISHDLRLAASYADEVLVMYAGRPVEYTDTEKLFKSTRMPYTRVLLEAMPMLDNSIHKTFNVVPGTAPVLTALPDGCTFHQRCVTATQTCKENVPPFEQQFPGHWCACWHPYEDN